MAQSGFTPVQLYRSSTATNVPTSGNLNAGELAINYTDGKLFYKDNANAVQVIGWKTTPETAGGTNQTTYATGDLLYASATNTLSRLAATTNGYVLTLVTGKPAWAAATGGGGTVSSFQTSLSGLTPNTATTGAITLAGTLGTTSGGTGLSTYTTGDIIYASATNTLSKLADVATGNALISGGVTTAPSWGKIGLSTHVSGQLPTANGGTNLTTFTSGGAMYATSTSVLTTGTLPATAGGTGQSSAFTQYGIVYASSTSALATTASAGAAGQILQSSATTPSWTAAATISTSITSPSHYGGTTASSTLTLQSTTGVGTTDAINMKVGNNGSVTALSISSVGVVTLSSALTATSGGTGLTTFTAANNAIYSSTSSTLTAGTLPVAAGGTGAVTLTAGYMIIGNGTSTVAGLAPGTNGNIARSNGTTWTSTSAVRVVSIAGTSGGTITPTGDTADQYEITALGAAATFAVPSGTPADGQKLSIRIKDNGTAQTLAWTITSGGYRIIGTTLPSTTTANKTIYLGCIYNSADVFWDVVAVATQA